ncbi:MAG: diguanylate cyclase [Campylobacterales bacterium]|nr:diguanylate cyclase [Campylobacterales bacterium]
MVTRLLFLLLFFTSLEANALKKATLQLSWFDQFQFAGYYMAQEKGFYKEAGLDVQLVPFAFGTNVLEKVESGRVDFGIGRESLLIDRARHRKIVALYALFQVSPFVFLTTEASGIRSVEDFKNKRIMITENDTEKASLQALFHSHQLKDYTRLPHTHDILSLVKGDTDVISAYLSKTPFELERMGVPYRVFYPKEYGFDMYSDFLYTSEELVGRDIGTVNAFRDASLKGWKYAYENIEEVAKYIFDHRNTQNLPLEALLYEGKVLKKLSYDQTQTLGVIDKNKLQRMYDLYNVMGHIPNQISINDFVLHHFGLLTPEEKTYLKEKGHITVCADPAWIPYERIQDAKLVGVSAQYLSLIEPLVGTSFTLLPTHSWEMSLAYAKNRHCDILTLAANTPERAAYLDFTSPYFSTPFVIATANETPFITDFAQVIDNPIGVVADYAVADILKAKYPEVNLVNVESIAEGLKLVARGELFGFVDSLVTINYVLQQDYTGILKIAGRVNGEYSLGFGVRNDEPLLRSILEKALHTIDAKAKQSISAQWTNVQYEKKFDYHLFWKIFVALGFVFALMAVRYRIIRSYNTEINKNLTIIDKYVILYRTDVRGTITHVSYALCETCGYTKAELIGKPHDIFYHPDMNPEIIKDLLATLARGKEWEGELQNKHKDGSTYWVDARISPAFDKHGIIEGYNAFEYNITDKKRIEALSNTDTLTQVPNRLYLNTCYNEKLKRAKRYKEVFSIIIIDVDYFKAINDTFGHSAGDQVLIEMASLLQSSIRDSDVLGRWGGEEFVIICPNTTKHEAAVLAEKIRNIVQVSAFRKGVIRLTCSFGVAHFEPYDNAIDTLNRADEALYRAKNGGRNQVVVDV